jgi:hypothetical protein
MLEKNEALACRHPEKPFIARTQAVADGIPVNAFIEDLNEELKSWRNGRKGPYLETLETLKQQVDEVRQEWTSVAGTLKTRRSA